MKLNLPSRNDALAVLVLIILFCGLAPLIGAPRTLIALASLYAFYVLLSEQWDLRDRLWFKGLMLLFVIIHLVVIVVVPLPNRISHGIIAMPLIYADFFLMYGITRRLRKRYTGSAAQE
jgi:hypothetical protein